LIEGVELLDLRVGEFVQNGMGNAWLHGFF
jgi:hypothetical protein